MARVVDAKLRLETLIEAATKVFIRAGFRGAQMADVAKEMGVATGTVYLYVESKEALFDLVMSRFPKSNQPDSVPTLPIPTPAPGATLAGIRERMLQPSRLPTLAAAVAARKPLRDSIGEELESIVRELYQRIHEYRLPILVMERCARDWPELSELFYRELRPDTVSLLERYLAKRVANNHFQNVRDIPIAARFILETVTWFARSRFASIETIELDNEQVEDSIVDLLRRAFVHAT